MAQLETSGPSINVRDTKVWHILGLLGIGLVYFGIVATLASLTFIA